MKGFPSKYGRGMMYRLPTVKTGGYHYSLSVFDQGTKLIFQEYSDYRLFGTKAPMCNAKNGLSPARDRFVLSVKKGVHLYKINKYCEHTKPIYQYNMLDLTHFEGSMDKILRLYKKKSQAYYNWLCKFTHMWLKRNGIDMPPMKFKAVSRAMGRLPSSHYLPRILQYATYPMIRDLYVHEKMPWLWGATKELSPHLRKHRSIRTLTKAIFGYSSRFLIGEMRSVMHRQEGRARKKDHIIRLGIALKGRIPVDYWPRIINALNNSKIFTYLNGNLAEEMKAFFKLFSSERILAMLTSTYTERSWVGEEQTRYAIGYLYDTIRNWYEFRDKITIPHDIVNLAKIHDYVSMEYRKLQNANHEIKLPKVYNDLHGKMVKNMSILIPKCTHDLIEWGQTMNNCIGGYGNEVLQGQTLCMAVLKEGEMIYNLEVRNKRVTHFLASRNSEPNPKDKELVCSYLKKQKIIT